MVLLDGGLATALEVAGHRLVDELWSARLVAEDPAAVVAAHRAYLRAGADVLITASYQASVAGFARVLGREDGDALLSATVALARRAVLEEGLASPADGGPLVAASVGPYGAVLADGSEYVGRYGVDVEALVAFHGPRVTVLAAAAPDVLACETVPCVEEAVALTRVLVAAAPGVPAWVSFVCGPDGRLVSGEDVAEAAATAAGCPSVVAVGVNCTAPAHVGDALARVRSGAPDLPLVAYPNAGRVWDGEARAWHGDGTDRLPPALVRRWVADGVRLLGGCCGIGPAGIAHLRTLLDGGADEPGPAPGDGGAGPGRW